MFFGHYKYARPLSSFSPSHPFLASKSVSLVFPSFLRQEQPTNTFEFKNMGGNSPCASCKLLRRRCAKDCIFAPYFPSDDPHKFAIVHKVFGASNVSKMLQELPVQQRADAVSSLVYEANARVRDPVYGCVGAISYLQNQVSQLQMQLAVAQAEILCIQMQQEPMVPTPQIDQDDKSFLLQHNLLPHHQYLNFSNSSTNVIQDSLKRESIFGDMVS